MLAPQNSLQQPVWTLELFGRGRLSCGAKVVQLERKTAALFAFLALEGETSRSKIAGLLWADSTEESARNSLRQRLYRLRGSVGQDLIVSSDPLRLAPNLTVDALHFESLIFTNDFQTALAYEGEFLADVDFDDCPELFEWVLTARERVEMSRCEALTCEANRFEQAGDFAAALVPALRLLERNGISENAHRRVMRLHYLHGDRSSAIKAFERCFETLQRELKLEPLAETLALAGLIERGAQLPVTPPAARVTLPLSILRPPVLVARAREWALLEAAWEARKVVFIVGDAGIGKTRLMLDFVETKGAFMPHNGRPGDAQIPYSTFSRGLRTIVGGDDKPAQLPAPWICRELLRLVPEKAARFEMELPAPIGSRDELLRFFDAITAFTKLSPRGWVAFVSDDLQFYDTASFELRMYMSGRLTDAQAQPIRNLVAYRRGALNPAIQALVEQMLASDQAVLIDLEALEAPAIQNFLTELQVPGLERLSPAISRYTGGNPMFVLETLKHLIETGKLEQDFPEHLPPPGRIGALVRQRLELLSVAALRLARVAAIAGTDFSLELGAKVLETGAMDLAEPLAELEQMQVMKGEKFAHDLIFEATLEGVPTAIQNLVHKSTAVYLESHDGNPARIAQHWIAAGESMKAVPFLKDAAVQAVTQYQLREAVRLATQGATILEGAGNPEQAWGFWEQARDALQELDQGAEFELVIKAMHRTASTPKQRAQSLNAECSMWLERDNLIKAKTIAALAIQASRESEDLYAIGTAEGHLGSLYWMQSEPSQAVDHVAISNEYAQLNLEQSIELMKPEVEIIKAKRELATTLSNFAVVLERLGRYEQSERKYKKAIEIFREIYDVPTLAYTLINLSLALQSLGRGHEALEHVVEAKQQQTLLNETTLGAIHTNSALCTAYNKLNQYTHALEYAHQTRVAAESSHGGRLFAALGRLGQLYRILGEEGQARYYFNATQTLPQRNDTFAVPIFREHALFLLEQGEDASEMIDRALNGYIQTDYLWAWYRTHLELLSQVRSEKQMQIINETLTKPSLQTMKGLHIVALTRGAQMQLELGEVEKALEFSQNAIALMVDYDPDIQRSEVLLTHCRALEANQHEDANPFLEQTLRWLFNVADHQVPPEYRESFLTRNPFNAAIIEAAKRAKLELPSSVTPQ